MRNNCLRCFAAALSICAAFFLITSSSNAGDTVKVYILAGQSNMEGKAPNALFEHQATVAKTKEFFSHLRDGDQWVERDDVFIKYLNRHGNLTLGYGSKDRTGAEYEFGYVMGEHHEDPVLLIKAAWGGHSLYKLFRSPSNPRAQEILDEELTAAIEKTKKNNEKRMKNDPLPTMESIKADYGKSYKNMLAEVEDTFENYETMFPALKGKKLEIAGFFWFQGWNDQYNGAEQEYAHNFEHFIKDIRKDLKAPNMPVVTAMMGQHGSVPPKPDSARALINKAQKSMESVPEFKGTVKAIATDVLIDKAAEALYPTWRDNFEQWQLTGGDHAYHYLGSAIWFTRIGKASADAMIELEK
ncbi:MAG: sialate O-acetylesterase [Blastopirellula sp.]|nr:MAG: sialate O-acetylesterase [Blastopirellula sp.]